MHVSDADGVARAIDLKERVRERLTKIPGVHGIGVGCKFVDRQRTDELAVLLYVHRKKPLADLPANEIIPPEIEGIQTDVREGDLGEFCDDATRYRPLVGGSKIEWTRIRHPTPNSTTRKEFDGTLGCLARSRKTGKKVALTAGHVVGCDPSLAVSTGRRIGQPDDDSDYSCCSKCWATVFGTVVDGSKDPDTAIIELDKCVDADPKVLDLGPVRGVLSTAEVDNLAGKTVQIRGYKTGQVRQGIVADVTHDDFLPCSEGTDPGDLSNIWNYHRAILVHPDPPNSQFGQKGDSGSAVLDMNGKLVGLFFALQMVDGVSTPAVSRIDRVLSTFQAKWDLEILTLSSAAMASSSSTTPAVHQFAAIEPAQAAAAGFQPTAEELQLLGQARDEVLATPVGQRLTQIIGTHVSEVQTLIRTRKRIAAVWRRIAGGDLFRALVLALRSPQSPLESFVSGIPLTDRISAMRKVLSRYASPALVADLQSFSGLATEAALKSYSQLLQWMKDAP